MLWTPSQLLLTEEHEDEFTLALQGLARGRFSVPTLLVWPSKYRL